MKAFLDNFAAVLGMATVALLLVSLSHEYGYFWHVGRHFQTFLTTSDYFNNAILWLPFIVFGLYVYLDWGILLGVKPFPPFGFNWASAIFGAFIAVLLLAQVFFTSSAFGIVLSILPLWFMYGMRLLPFSEANSEILLQVRRALFIVPVVGAMLFAWGVDRGKYDILSFDEPYTIQTKAGEILHRILLSPDYARRMRIQ
jgi:hypothetical protein